MSVEDPLDLGPEPVDRFDERCLWWRHELLHRQVMKDPLRLLPLFAEERAEAETRWRSDPPTPRSAFAEADALLARWTERVRSVGVRDRRPPLVRRYWQKRDRWAGFPAASEPLTGAPS